MWAFRMARARARTFVCAGGEPLFPRPASESVAADRSFQLVDGRVDPRGARSITSITSRARSTTFRRPSRCSAKPRPRVPAKLGGAQGLSATGGRICEECASGFPTFDACNHSARRFQRLMGGCGRCSQGCKACDGRKTLPRGKPNGGCRRSRAIDTFIRRKRRYG